MRYLICLLLSSCAALQSQNAGVKVFTKSGECQKSFTEDLTKNTFQVVYFCGAEGNVVIKVQE